MQAEISSESQLLTQSRDGDEAAYGQIVKRYQSLICSVAYSRCGDLAQSEDLAQEAFLTAWRKLSDLKDLSKFRSWICTIVRNLASESQAKSSRKFASNTSLLDSVAEPVSSATDPCEKLVSAEQEQLVWSALAGIPEIYREPMILFYREEQSVSTVAEALGISQDAVKQRLSRGRKFLHEQLAATVEEALEKSKPSNAFAGAVMLGLSSAKAPVATSGVALGAASKAAGLGWSGLFLMQFAQLPLIAWLFKTSLDQCRSDRERQMNIRHMACWMLALIPMTLLMFGSISWQQNFESPLRGLIIPGIMVVYFVPMVLSSRRLGKQIERLRVEEGTDTPLGTIAEDQADGGAMTSFVGGAMLVALCPALMPLIAGDWLSVAVLAAAALGIGVIGSKFCATRKSSFRAYGMSLGAMAFVGIGVMFLGRNAWSDSFANPMGWWTGSMMAMSMMNVVLSMLAWKRVYGKPVGNPPR